MEYYNHIIRGEPAVTIEDAQLQSETQQNQVENNYSQERMLQQSPPDHMKMIK